LWNSCIHMYKNMNNLCTLTLKRKNSSKWLKGEFWKPYWGFKDFKNWRSKLYSTAKPNVWISIQIHVFNIWIYWFQIIESNWRWINKSCSIISWVILQMPCQWPCLINPCQLLWLCCYWFCWWQNLVVIFNCEIGHVNLINCC
jgi:hypothetical protein